MASELRETIPTFNQAEAEGEGEVSLTNWSALTSQGFARNWGEVGLILLVAIVLIVGAEFAVRAFNIQSYIFPPPSAIATTLVTRFGDLFWPHMQITLIELLAGFTIGASIGLILAAVITQVPLIEKIITPYILLLVTTPMIALVPLLILVFGFTLTPRIIAVALATGPMVMINAATGFRRTDLAKIALARSYGASTLQIFTKIRFPLALPMIIVGLMVGAIFGMLTAVGAEMVGGKNGLGNQLMFWSSMVKMENFYAIILLLALMGVTIYVIFYWIGKKWAGWQA
ncbi:MAG TPA: ABC transporter permease [Thermomicrobiales bacterium]|nr:ABC transporter permease [Thermomicrobiales bacterium]